MGPAEIDDALKALYGTGLFEDVHISHPGARIVVTVVEAPVINQVAFEGNKKAKDEQLKAEVQSKPRGTLSKATVQADVQRIIEIYQRSGQFDVRVDPKIIELPNNRVNLVFEIKEGAKTGVKEINFVGIHAFSSGRLKDVIKTAESNCSASCKPPTSTIRTVSKPTATCCAASISSTAMPTCASCRQPAYTIRPKRASSSRSRSTRAANIMSAPSTWCRMCTPSIRRRCAAGSSSARAASTTPIWSRKSVEAMTIEAAKRGYAFANVHPRGDRNFQTKTINLAFVVEEGARAYIERINIRGNTRTRDYVIRREFDIGEGDAYNRALIDRAERRLKNLDFFKTVKITNEPGSAPDRVVINVNVEEKSTGEFSVSGGYSTSRRFHREASVAERNLMGRGQFAKAAVTYGQYTRGVDLSFVEPYLLGYRMAGGIDVFWKQNLANSYLSYNTKTIGINLRLGFALTEELAFQPRYSIYRQEITLPTVFERLYAVQQRAD